MKKKILYAILLVALVVLCLGVLSSCRNQTVSFFDYSEKDLGPIGQFVSLMHGWIGNYGWTVVVFTVFLKIVTLPLDFWRSYSSRKSALKMQRMQPLVDAIDKRYGANTQRANEEKQKLYKKQGYSMASMCLPVIISMVIFFVMFGGLRNYSTYSSITSFQNLSETYHNTYYEQILEKETNEDLKAKYIQAYNDEETEAQKAGFSEKVVKVKAQVAGIQEALRNNSAVCNEAQQEALKAVQDEYVNNHESWLWIQNVWQPDTWATIMQPYKTKNMFTTGFSQGLNMDNYPGEPEETYNIIRDAVLETGGYGNNGSWNGLMILPLMSVGLSFLSTFTSQLLEKKNRKGEVVQNQQQAATNKTMMIIMPLMMAWFGFIYTGAFAIYIVVSNMFSIISMLALRIPVEKAALKKLDKEDRKNNSSKASYMR